MTTTPSPERIAAVQAAVDEFYAHPPHQSLLASGLVTSLSALLAYEIGVDSYRREDVADHIDTAERADQARILAAATAEHGIEFSSVNLREAVAKRVGENVPVLWEHSGGGCGTLYVGTAYQDTDGDLRFPILVGPGHYHEQTLHTGELSWGPDDDGVSDPGYYPDAVANVDGVDEPFTAAAVVEFVADHIAAAYEQFIHAHPEAQATKLTDDQISEIVTEHVSIIKANREIGASVVNGVVIITDDGDEVTGHEVCDTAYNLGYKGLGEVDHLALTSALNEALDAEKPVVEDKRPGHRPTFIEPCGLAGLIAHKCADLAYSVFFTNRTDGLGWDLVLDGGGIVYGWGIGPFAEDGYPLNPTVVIDNEESRGVEVPVAYDSDEDRFLHIEDAVDRIRLAVVALASHYDREG